MFLAAIILNLFSSYLIASIAKNILVIFISFFAFIVFDMEVLSLFHIITRNNVIIFSLLNLIFSILFFKFTKSAFLKINFDFERLKNSLKLDKSLCILSFAFIVLLLVTLILSLIIPVLEPDSQTYHFIRAYDFVKFKSLNHFEINDIRALIMPINSEIIYAWMYLFKKTLYGYGILSYCAFIVFIFSFWQILEKLKFCFRKRLFAIFVFSSFSSVIVQIPSLQTDIVVGCLITLAFLLFLNEEKMSVYFASLSLALAVGTKSTAIMALGAFFVLIFCFEKFVLKTKNYKKIGLFSLYFIVNFLIFSSYNYISNFLQFHNFLSNNCALVGHGFWGGIKGYIANIIHFCFQGLDFTGFKWGYYLNDKILALKDAFFDLIHIPQDTGCNIEQEKINIITDEQTVGFGILGFLVFIPMLFLSIFKIFKNKNKRTIALFVFGIVFILNILVLARAIAYLVYSIRFIIAFVCLSAPVLVYSYSKKGIYKKIIVFFSLFYMFLLPFCIRRMPFWRAIHILKFRNYNLEAFAKDCYENRFVSVYPSGHVIYKTINERYKDKKNIAIIKTLVSSMLYLTTLENDERKIDFLNAGLINEDKLKKYDLVILESEIQNDNIFNKEDVKINYEKEDNKIIFKDNNHLNCFFHYYDKKGKFLNTEDATERACFTYYYFQNLKNFKLDYRENAYEEENKINHEKQTLNIYYFVNQIKD